MRVLRYLFFFLVIVVVAALAVPFVLPPNVIADQIAKAARDSTGRDLSLGDNIAFSIYPDLALSISDVTLSNPPDMPNGVVLKSDRLRVSLQLLPLLGGNVKIKTFELVAPTFNLLTDVEGRSNWAFGSRPSDRDEPSDPSPSGESWVGDLSLDDVRIVDGVVRYLDEAAGVAHEGTALNVVLSLPRLDSDLEMSGSMVWRGETVDLSSVLGPIDRLNREKTAGLRLEIASKHLSTTFDGTLSLADGLALDGTLDAKSPSLRKLAAWTGKPLAPGHGLEDFSASAKVRIGSGEIALLNARIGLDGMRAQGDLTVETAGERPMITANLGVDQIDLNRYLAVSTGKSSKAATEEWSEAPLDFAGLRAVDADLRLAATRIRYRDVTVNDSAVNVGIENGRLQAKLERLSLYDGLAIGTVSLEDRSGTPAITMTFSSQEVAALPLLRDFAEFDWIEGTARLTASLNATGNSQRQLVQNLNGKVAVLFEDGAIRGINIAQMMRGLGTDILNGWSRSPSQKTDFASLSANYTVTNGAAVNTDLNMVGPLVRMTGGGVVEMPGRRIDYKVDPKLVASLEGQGGQADLAGFNVPIKIEGPWSNPDIYPDIAGILDNPAEALKKLKAIGDIDPGRLGLDAESVLSGGTDAVEDAGDSIQKTISETFGRNSQDDDVVKDLFRGLGGD